jgi:hypothetical protein
VALIKVVSALAGQVEHFIYLTGSDKLVEQEYENRSGYRLPYALCKKRS